MSIIKPDSSIKVISDGTSIGTKVIHIETGEEIRNVAEITLKINAMGLSTATLILCNIPAEINGVFKIEKAMMI